MHLFFNIFRFLRTKTPEKVKKTHQQVLVDKKELENFILRCIIAAGSSPDHAKMMSDCLIAADLRGHYSHGLSRLGNKFQISKLNN